MNTQNPLLNFMSLNEQRIKLLKEYQEFLRKIDPLLSPPSA